MKQDKTRNSNSIILTICIATTLICIALTFWGNWKNNGVLTTDAYISIIATFIGVCATIIVGVQILNAFEVRNMQNQLKELQKQREKLDNDRKVFASAIYDTKLCIGDSLELIAVFAKNDDNKHMELYALMQSVLIDDWNSRRGKILLNRYNRISELSKFVFPTFDNIIANEWYTKMSTLSVPDDIKYFEDIMKLHYKLLSELKQIAEGEQKNI